MLEVENIKIVGVGGAGNNVVSRMMVAGISDVTCININTDKATLAASGADERLQIGEKITRGQGAGSKPEIGRLAAEEDRNAIAKLLEGTDALFLTAGMGGGTGTGAIPVVADIAREMGILTVAVVSMPFRWEGPRKMRTAAEGLEILHKKVDTLFVIPNENIRKVSKAKISFAEAFSVSDEILNRAVTGIVDLLRSTGFINLDFADLKAILSNSGRAHLGIGEASGKDKVQSAAEQVIKSELTETGIANARRIIANLTVSPELEMDEVTGLMERIQEVAHPDVNLIFGLGYDETLVDALRIIVIATDFDEGIKPVAAAEPKKEPRAESGARGRFAAAAQPASRAAQEAPEEEAPVSRRAERGPKVDENFDGWFDKYFGKDK